MEKHLYKGGDTKTISDTGCFVLLFGRSNGSSAKDSKRDSWFGSGHRVLIYWSFFPVVLIREPAFHIENEIGKIILHVVCQTDQIFWSRFFLCEPTWDCAKWLLNSTKLYVGALMKQFIQLLVWLWKLESMLSMSLKSRKFFKTRKMKPNLNNQNIFLLFGFEFTKTPNTLSVSTWSMKTEWYWYNNTTCSSTSHKKKTCSSTVI